MILGNPAALVNTPKIHEKNIIKLETKKDINETVKLDIPLINKALKGENNQDEFVNNLNNDEYIQLEFNIIKKQITT